jgi:putative ABC transport system permease protein
MDSFMRDVRHAVRGLVARRTFSVIVIATIALVIAAATAVFAVVNVTLLRPLPFPHADRLTQVFLMPPGDSAWTSRNPQTLGSFLRFRQRAHGAELIEGLWSRERALGGGSEPEVVIAGGVSPGLFSLFGGTPLHGRTFTEAEDQANAKVVVLSHALWQRRFGADPAIVGTSVLIDRAPYEVIGVMPSSYVTGFVPTDLWTPLNAGEATVPSGNTVVQTFARLKPGASVAQFQNELSALMPAIAVENPNALKGWSPLAVDLRTAQFRLQQPTILALAGGVIALLLIACANLANLMLAELVSRRSQLALRLALGGGRGSLVRLHVIEALMLSVTGALLGLIAGVWLLPALLALDPTLAPTFGAIRIDWRVQLAATSAAVAVTLIASLTPLLNELRRDLAGAVTAGSRRTIGSRGDRRVRAMLVGAECALSVVLLSSAALMLSAFDRSSRVTTGFDPGSVLAAQLRLSETAYPTEAARADFVSRVLDRIRAVPGVSAAGVTLNRFIPGFYVTTRVQIDGKPAPDGQPYVVHFRRVSAGYFNTMHIPFVRGRDFSAADALDQPWVVIVSRQFADRFWPGEDPIGRGVRRGTNPRVMTVIGVAGDVRDTSLSQPPAPTVYIPFSQNNVAIAPASLVVRTTGDPRGFTKAIRAAVLSVDPLQPIDSVTTVEQFLSDSIGPQRFRSVLLLALGIVGLALAALGVYGITSRAVAERTAELGLRLALGATPGSLARLIVWQSLRAVAAGLSVGLLLTGAAAIAMFAVVPGLERHDSWLTLPVVIALALVAAVAAIIPSRRAVSLAPTVALRGD